MIATQEYVWTQLAEAAGLGWPEATGWAMAQAAAAGLTAWEPLLHRPGQAEHVAALASRHGLAMPSIFLTGTLHDPGLAPGARTRMTETVRAAVPHGCRAACVYPAPTQSGEAKSCQQLVEQAEQLSRLAAEFRAEGVRLLYHPEELEMRDDAREVHQVLRATDPALVGLCLDPDTVWRGASGSMAGVLDFLEAYGARVDEVHLRQVQGGVWTEALGPGDVDLQAVATALRVAGARPFIVIEHALEPGTPMALGPVEAHRRSLRVAEGLFAS